jgi:colanic acid/amylovoran biosynthesis glycosyltransferase
MLAIAAPSFHQPSETFIRAHVRDVLPGRTVLICRDDTDAAALGCPVLSDIRPLSLPKNPAERFSNSLRFRWWRYVDPALRGANERRVRSFLERHGVRAMLAEYGTEGCLLRIACKRAGIPLYVHFHGYDATRLARHRHWRRHYRRLFRDAAGIIAPSEFLAAKLRDLGCPDEKLSVSPNGINISGFRETVRERGRLVAVGRLVEKKAPHLTIQAFAKVSQTQPYCTLDIVGEGPLREKCVAEVIRLGLRDRVKLHGAQSPEFVRELLQKAELFVQHSVTARDGDMESFGISLVEAMACSVAVVATDHNGFSETVVSDGTGILVAEHDVDGMATAILSLLDDRVRAETMGRAGRARVEAKFTHENTAARLREIMGLAC